MLGLAPISLAAANEFVTKLHRHHKPSQGHKFSISAVKDGETVGVVIVGRPVSRMLDDGLSAEAVRLCTDGTPNACSMLYGAAWRAARAMGYARIYTYILASEPGASLKAAGWVCEGPAGGGSWDRTSRSREDKHPLESKVRWRAGEAK